MPDPVTAIHNILWSLCFGLQNTPYQNPLTGPRLEQVQYRLPERGHEVRVAA